MHYVQQWIKYLFEIAETIKDLNESFDLYDLTTVGLTFHLYFCQYDTFLRNNDNVIHNDTRRIWHGVSLPSINDGVFSHSPSTHIKHSFPFLSCSCLLPSSCEVLLDVCVLVKNYVLNYFFLAFLKNVLETNGFCKNVVAIGVGNVIFTYKGFL